jgi:hypothetical protein
VKLGRRTPPAPPLPLRYSNPPPPEPRLVATSDLDAISDLDNVVPFVAASDRQRQFLYGPLSSDRRHVIKAHATYMFERPRIAAGTSLTVASGAPMSRLYFNPFLGGFYDFRAPRGVDPGDLSDPHDDRARRTPWIVDWNLYGAWSLPRFGDFSEASLELQVTNVHDRRSAMVVDERNTPAFGQAVVRQSPIRVAIGILLRY